VSRGPVATPACSEWGPRALARRSGSNGPPIDGSAASSGDVCLTLPLLPAEIGCCGTSAPHTAPHSASFDSEAEGGAFLCLCPLSLSWPSRRATLIAWPSHGRLSFPTRCGTGLLSPPPRDWVEG